MNTKSLFFIIESLPSNTMPSTRTVFLAWRASRYLQSCGILTREEGQVHLRALHAFPLVRSGNATDYPCTLCSTSPPQLVWFPSLGEGLISCELDQVLLGGCHLHPWQICYIAESWRKQTHFESWGLIIIRLNIQYKIFRTIYYSHIAINRISYIAIILSLTRICASYFLFWSWLAKCLC